MPCNTSQSYRISEYLKCNPKAFSTWAYVAIILIPSSPTHHLYLFLQRLFASISKLSSTLFNTSMIYHLLNNLLRLMYYPTSTTSGIIPNSSSFTLPNPCWQPLSISLIFIRYPFLWWNTHPFVLPSSSTIIFIHIPTHLRIYIPESVTSTNGSIWHFSPVFPFNLPFRVIITWYWFLLSLFSSHNFNIPSSNSKKKSSLINHPSNLITTIAVKKDTSLCFTIIFFSPLYSS